MLQQPAAFTMKSSGGRLNVLMTTVEVIIPNSTQSVNISAIWDTGASATAITKKVVDDLGLVPTGVTNVHTAAGEVIQNTYIINVGLPNGVVIQGIIATEVPALSGGCDALIGMDIIGFGDFSVTNFGNTTCMSFRIPSLHEIDYAKNPLLTFKDTIKPTITGGPPIGRNDKCPCGSGKKYKQCHGK